MDRDLIKPFIARRAAKELRDGEVVNLGIGLPTLVPSYLPEGVSVTIHSDNGIIGLAAASDENSQALYVVDAGGFPAAIVPGGSYIDSATSFSLIRGGHIDTAILGGLEVDEEGYLANWTIPGVKMPGMGGAMDLMAGAKRVIVTMEHTAGGKKKIIKKSSLPYTAIRRVDLIITEMVVIKVTAEGLILMEYNPEFTIEDIQDATEASLIVSPELKPMV